MDALKRLQAETAAELEALLPAILNRAFKENHERRRSFRTEGPSCDSLGWSSRSERRPGVTRHKNRPKA